MGSEKGGEGRDREEVQTGGWAISSGLDAKVMPVTSRKNRV